MLLMDYRSSHGRIEQGFCGLTTDVRAEGGVTQSGWLTDDAQRTWTPWGLRAPTIYDMRK